MATSEELAAKAEQHFENKSSPQELENFTKSFVFQDFKRVMEDRVKVLQNDMMQVNSIEEFKSLQGEIRGVMFWQMLPERLVQYYKQIDEVEKLKKEQEDGKEQRN